MISDLSANIYCRCDTCCHCHAPKYVSVEGAGYEAVNGVYKKMDTLTENAAAYVLKGTRSGIPANFYIILCRTTSNEFLWFISTTPDGKTPGKANDIDFYQASESDNLAIFPPIEGWKVDGEGIHPPPTLLYGSQYRLSREVIRHRGNKAARLGTPCLSSLLKKGTFEALIREAAVYWTIAQTLHLCKDREHLSTAIVQFIFSNSEDVGAARSKILQAINVCNRREQCVLLELAVWKSLCTVHRPSNANDVLAWSDWFRKSEVRSSNAVHVIMTAVIPFLDFLVTL
jgi:hypothetical protein